MALAAFPDHVAAGRGYSSPLRVVPILDFGKPPTRPPPAEPRPRRSRTRAAKRSFIAVPRPAIVRVAWPAQSCARSARFAQPSRISATRFCALAARRRGFDGVHLRVDDTHLPLSMPVYPPSLA
jgi:hypothetical protein